MTVKVKEYLEQNDIMVIKNLPRYVFAISSLYEEKGKSLLLSFSLAHPDLIGKNNLSDQELMAIAGDQEIVGQLALPLHVLKTCLQKMENE
jgi:hypothetical protein